MTFVNQRQVKYLQIDTLANMKLAKTQNAGALCYCDQQKTLYRYEPNGAAYTANDLDVTITGDGLNTRRIGISGQYINSAILSGSGSPIGSVIPRYLGDRFLDTNGPTFYHAFGLNNTDRIS